jgi:hypothetical protein
MHFNGEDFLVLQFFESWMIDSLRTLEIKLALILVQHVMTSSAEGTEGQNVRGIQEWYDAITND